MAKLIAPAAVLSLFTFGVPALAIADFEIPSGATLVAHHAGATVTDAWIDDQPPVIEGAALAEITSAWAIEFISPWEAIPAERAAYVLARINNLDDERVEAYSLVHAPVPDDGSDETIESQTVSFDLPPLGDPATPAGFYQLRIFKYPEMKYVCQEVEPYECFDEPYTDQDFAEWFHWRHEVDYSTFEGEIPVTYEPESSRGLAFQYSAGEVPQPTIDPVIIIPGILGSEKNSDGVWVIDPILHAYDDLIATLDANHYTLGTDLFTFPYDWRKSNVETAVLLKQKIEDVKGICGCGKVDLVAHSMGGLVARQYIQSGAYEGDVDQLIFLGTPHLGAPKAYLMWEGGETDPEGVENFVLQQMLDQEAYEKGYSSLFDYVRNEPIFSVQELLPTYGYIFVGNNLRDYPTHYPINAFLENLNNQVSSLLSAGVDIHNFWSNTADSDTITAINAIDAPQFSPMWTSGYPEGFYESIGNRGIERGSGDSTVPSGSASFIQSGSIVATSTHNTLPDNFKAKVYETLVGSTPTTLVDNFNLINIRLILIKMFSPADLLIIAPDGKKIGKENGQVINQIPGAFYSGFNTDTEYITILNPLDGEYKVTTEGTGTGSYTVEANYISEATTTAASYTGDTSPGVVSELHLEVSSANPEDLQLEGADAEPPVITITSPLAKDYLRSEQLTVKVTAEDAGAGVHSLETKLDGTVIPNVGTVDLFFKSLGTHALAASSTDTAGNATTSSRAFRIIANATSTRSDFERAYALGWMTKKVHDELAKKIKKIVILRKVIKNIVQTIVETGRNGKKTTKNVQKKIESTEEVLDKAAAKAILKELDKYRGKGLDERAYQLLKEDIQWLVNH